MAFTASHSVGTMLREYATWFAAHHHRRHAQRCTAPLTVFSLDTCTSIRLQRFDEPPNGFVLYACG